MFSRVFHISVNKPIGIVDGLEAVTKRYICIVLVVGMSGQQLTYLLSGIGRVFTKLIECSDEE